MRKLAVLLALVTALGGAALGMANPPEGDPSDGARDANSRACYGISTAQEAVSGNEQASENAGPVLAGLDLGGQCGHPGGGQQDGGQQDGAGSGSGDSGSDNAGSAGGSGQ